MRIENVMEMPDKYMGAYNYYKKYMENSPEETMTRTALLAKVARMFMIPNFRHFENFVNQMEEDST